MSDKNIGRLLEILKKPAIIQGTAFPRVLNEHLYMKSLLRYICKVKNITPELLDEIEGFLNE